MLTIHFAGHLVSIRIHTNVEESSKCPKTVFLDQLFAFGPKKVVYISCDPATQARDTKEIIDAGYTIRSVQPFDLFPQTRHIENVIYFTRNH